jgi:hypothetical protein
MCLAWKPSKKKKLKVRAISEQITATQTQGTRITRRIIDQPTLHDFFELPGGDRVEQETIEASGDAMLQIEDGHIRIALQNPNGIRLRENVQVLPEVAAISQMGLDIAVFPETKLARGGQTVEVLCRQLSVQSSVRVIQSAAPRHRNSASDYQPGGD